MTIHIEIVRRTCMGFEKKSLALLLLSVVDSHRAGPLLFIGLSISLARGRERKCVTSRGSSNNLIM